METIITAITRAPSSAAGNPAYWLITDDGRKIRTSANVGWAYGITNSPAHGGLPVGVPVRLEINGRGTVDSFETVG